MLHNMTCYQLLHSRLIHRDSRVIANRSFVNVVSGRAQVSAFSSGSGKVAGALTALGASFYSTSPVRCSVAAESSGPEFKITASGLRYRDLNVGTGPSPKKGDEVSVHYTGWLEGFDSQLKFDSSYDRKAPLEFGAGIGQVIEGNRFCSFEA